MNAFMLSEWLNAIFTPLNHLNSFGARFLVYVAKGLIEFLLAAGYPTARRCTARFGRATRAGDLFRLFNICICICICICYVSETVSAMYLYLYLYLLYLLCLRICICYVSASVSVSAMHLCLYLYLLSICTVSVSAMFRKQCLLCVHSLRLL
jgi:hypothetical protein